MSLDKEHINRQNYEEFFLLYIDNELSEIEKKAVDSFLITNPDLLEELNSLKEVVLIPETSTHFNKQLLLLKDGKNAMNTHNYEEKFLLYIDNELDETAKHDVETFVLQHPTLQNRFTLLKQSKLVAETIVFPNKHHLYKKERKVAYMRSLFVAAAAAVFIGLCFNVMIERFYTNQNGITKTVTTHYFTDHEGQKVPLVSNNKDATKSVKVDPKTQLRIIKTLVNRTNEEAVMVDPSVINLYKEKTTVNNKVTKQTSSVTLNSLKNDVPEELKLVKDSEALVTTMKPSELKLEKAINETKQGIVLKAKNEEAIIELPQKELAISTVYKEPKQQVDDERIAICNIDIKKEKLRGLLKNTSSILNKLDKISSKKEAITSVLLRSLNKFYNN